MSESRASRLCPSSNHSASLASRYAFKLPRPFLPLTNYFTKALAVPCFCCLWSYESPFNLPLHCALCYYYLGTVLGYIPSYPVNAFDCGFN